jgi:hypothetical protein
MTLHVPYCQERVFFSLERGRRCGPEANTLASKLKATALTREVWPLKRLMIWAVVTSHKKTFLSPPQEANLAESGELGIHFEVNVWAEGRERTGGHCDA